MGLLDGRVAVVTGGGRGIGREHCLELARAGASVVVNDPGHGVHGEESGEAPADAVVKAIVEAGGQAAANKGSVTSWGDCQAMLEQAIDTFGGLDVVVNNAGILRDRMITSLTEDDFDAVIAVHVKGTFSMTKHACDYWRQQSKAGQPVSGRIINTTSSSGLVGNLGQAPYSTAKAGIVGLTLVTAIEMDRYGVTCNAVSPVARTRMTSVLVADRKDEAPTHAYEPLHPRTSSPVVAYLASKEAGWISGQVLRVEGNTVIRMQGWQKSAQTYAAADGGFLQPDELVLGMRRAYGSFPGTFVTPLTSEG
jgi:NAD(P)-dependent dehydrogenase (short-subunit alcohol dehydrogenase family)